LLWPPSEHLQPGRLAFSVPITEHVAQCASGEQVAGWLVRVAVNHVVSLAVGQQLTSRGGIDISPHGLGAFAFVAV
jgi:hypothetical protein